LGNVPSVIHRHIFVAETGRYPMEYGVLASWRILKTRYVWL
jgi:hypothetical protein